MRFGLGGVTATFIAAVLVAGCGGAAGGERELTVFAAASLRVPLEDAASAYESARPGIEVRLSLGSSAALRTQIEQGAPADLFLSADVTNVTRLADAGRADGAPRPFASNGLIVVVPADGRSAVHSPADLAADGVHVIAAGAEVPITRYADELVVRLARLPGYPDDFGERYAANVVSREDDVKAVVAKVELGEGDAAIVYRTDARASARVTAIEVPPEAQVAATYAGVVVAGSKASADATAFLDWLIGPDGRAILARAGFGAPP
jgi:molybdate transport system substrate-binding protein